ncbi:MAG: 2-C-methyl-D-erythritol 4-phosphate cytidylyltransferase [Lentisphaerales bacterium]|nr:2-C-methyl-D-erythritol 4-phosphate cytidylyltransferase [Lentisphaerales bacterium]
MPHIEDLGIVIVAGGSSSRFGKEDKLLIDIDGMPILAHSVKAFTSLVPPENITVVTSAGREEELQQVIEKHLNLTVRTVTGGVNRSDSSLNGIKSLASLRYAAVHDAARPFIDPKTIKACYEALKSKGSAVLARPVTDTIKVVDDAKKVLLTPPRATLCAAETPQMFKTAELISAYENAPEDGTVTDEAMAMEIADHSVYLFLHEGDNRKITYSTDLK